MASVYDVTPYESGLVLGIVIGALGMVLLLKAFGLV